MEHTLQNLWAHTTLSVIHTVTKKQGQRFYRNDPVLNDDLESYLTLQAQKIANAYEPDHNADNPENYWAAYLYKALTNRSRYHWSEWIGTKTSQPGYETAVKANLASSRLEHILNKDNQTMQLHQQVRSMTGMRVPSPEDHYLRLEDLAQRLIHITKEPLPELNQCIEQGCEKKRYANGRCAYHSEVHRGNWTGRTCTTEGCTRGGVVKGMCRSHYRAAHEKAKQEGTWKPKEIPTHCSVKNCTKPHTANGFCRNHYNQQHIKNNPPCTTQNCTNKQRARGLCNTHYKQLRKKERNNG